MISDNFWKILFVLMVLGGIVFWYKSYLEKKSFNSAASNLADLIAFKEETMPRDEHEAHGRFIKAVTLLHQAEAAGQELAPLIAAAHEYNGITTDSGEARMITNCLFEGLTNGAELGIFTDDAIWDLQDGQEVPITKGPFEGEKIAISYHVQPSIGPGAKLFLGNFVLVPESVAAASQDIELTENVLNTSIKLVNANIITQDDHNAIKTNYNLMRDRNRRGGF